MRLAVLFAFYEPFQWPASKFARRRIRLNLTGASAGVLLLLQVIADDIKYLADIRRKFLEDLFPTSTFIGVTRLANPAWVVEQEVVAAKAD